MSEEGNDNGLGGVTTPVVIDEDDSKEEEDLLYELYGRNEVPVVKVWGWTRSTVMSFPNLKENLCMQRFDKDNETSKGHHKTIIEETAEIAEGISRLAKFTDSFQYLTSQHKVLCVQVVAKKKVDTIVVYPKDEEGNRSLKSPGQVLILGQLIVADESGACLLSLFNESVQIIHNQVEVGDYLIMNKFQYKKVKVEEDLKFVHPFQTFFHPVELKVEKYSVRHIRHFPWQKQSFKIQLPSYLFPALDTATGEESQSQGPGAVSTTVAYEDIAGVVCHVGRIERTLASTHIIKCALNESLQSEERRDRKIRLFLSYRWIRVISKSGETRWLKIFVEKLSSMKTQEELVPGAVILITNCSVGSNERGKKEIYTGVYSEVYVNEQVEFYCRLMSEEHVKTLVTSVLGLRAYLHTIENHHQPWGIGGTYHPPITNPAKYLTTFKEMEQEANESDSPLLSSSERKNFFTAMPKRYACMEWEKLALIFRGKIVLVWEVWGRNSELHMPIINGSRFSLNRTIYGKYESFCKEYRKSKKSKNQPPMLHERHPCVCSKCRREQWLSLARKGPMEVLPRNTTRETISAITGKFKEMCSPLIPMFGPDANKTVDLTLLADLPLLEEFDNYRVVLQDIETRQFYEAAWTTYSMEEMRARIKAAEKKEIVCEIHIFQLPGFRRRELILRDFVVDEETEEWKRKKALCVKLFETEQQRDQEEIANVSVDMFEDSADGDDEDSADVGDDEDSADVGDDIVDHAAAAVNNNEEGLEEGAPADVDEVGRVGRKRKRRPSARESNEEDSQRSKSSKRWSWSCNIV